MEKSNRANRFSPEVRARAVRMILEHEHEYANQSAAIMAIAPKIGCGPDTLRAWVRRAETDGGRRDGLTTAERDRIKALERENRQLRQANEILKKASAYFAPTLTHASMCCRAAGRSSTARFGNDCVYPLPDRASRRDVPKGREHRGVCGVEPICRVLQIAPSTFYAHLAVERNPERASDRAKHDDELRPEIKQVWEDNRSVYGARKLWHAMRREGFDLARCTPSRACKHALPGKG